MSFKRRWAVPAAAALALVLCACSTPRVNSGVYLDADIQNTFGYCPSLEVDLVGVTEAEKKRLEAYNLDRYFSDDDEFRKSLDAVTFKFSSDDMTAKRLDRGSGCWDRWQDKGAVFLAALANLPYTAGEGDDKSADPRRLVIDLNDGWLFNSRTHDIRVGMGGVIEIKNAPKVKTETVYAP